MRFAVIGGVLLLAGIFLLVMLSGCAVGYTEPATDGSRAALLGWKLDEVAAAGGRVGGFFAGWLGSLGTPEGIATVLGGGGAIGVLASLVRAWAGQKARAESAIAASEAHDDAWDEASGAKAAALAKSAAVQPVHSDGSLAGGAA